MLVIVGACALDDRWLQCQKTTPRWIPQEKRSRGRPKETRKTTTERMFNNRRLTWAWVEGGGRVKDMYLWKTLQKPHLYWAPKGSERENTRMSSI